MSTGIRFSGWYDSRQLITIVYTYASLAGELISAEIQV